jgi:hypothetical protein
MAACLADSYPSASPAIGLKLGPADGSVAAIQLHTVAQAGSWPGPFKFVMIFNRDSLAAYDLA